MFKLLIACFCPFVGQQPVQYVYGKDDETVWPRGLSLKKFWTTMGTYIMQEEITKLMNNLDEQLSLIMGTFELHVQAVVESMEDAKSITSRNDRMDMDHEFVK